MSSPAVLRLLTQDDWIQWYNYIKSEAKSRRIWRFVDPEDANPPVNTPPDLEYYTRDQTRPAAPLNPPAPGPSTTGSQTSDTSTQTAQPSPGEPIPTTPAAPATPVKPMERFLAITDAAGKWNAYKMANDEYNRMEKP